MFEGIPAQQVQIDTTIRGVVKDDLSSVAALGDVVWNTGCHHTSNSRHLNRKVSVADGKSPPKSGKGEAVTRFLAR